MRIPDRKLTMSELDRVTPEAYARQPLRPIRLVLDDVRSRHNVGSMFRTADAFGIEGLLLCGFTPQPPHREIEKTALGSTSSVPWMAGPDIIAELSKLKTEGYRIVAVEQTERAIRLDRFELDTLGPVALVMGNELTGVSEAVVREADACLTVPQFGSKHSLNVSVCAGVVLWHLTSAWTGLYPTGPEPR
ncbi:MAG: RNA methyltransferase [Flavobacteriales bacterium]